MFKGTSIASVSVLAASLLLAACGSSQSAPAESPESGSAEAKPAEPAPEKAPAEAKAEAPKEPEGPSLTRTVVETITEPGNGWVFSNEGGGWEYPLYLIVLSAAQVLLGEGAWALGKSREAHGRLIAGQSPA